jgi:plastocyanin
LAAAFGAGAALAASSVVTLGSSGPHPADVTVQWGDTVTFTNGSGETHGVTIPRLTVASPPIPPGGSWAQVFDGRTGNYQFRQTGSKNFPGTVVVQLMGTVTMTATPAIVTYGKAVTFRGTALPGFPVKLEYQATGQAGVWKEAGTVQAASDGAWSTSLVPEVGGRYRATAAADQLRSPVLAVGVRPRISVTAPRRARAGSRVTLRVRIAPAGAGTTADLERYNSRGRRWVREARGRINASGRVSFRVRATPGRSLFRIELLRFALRPGYESVTGKAFSVTGT